MLAKLAYKGACSFIACALAFSALPVIASVQAAQADELAELEARVKESAASYNAAVARQEELSAEIAELDGKIGVLEKELPKQQAHSDESFCALYKYSYDTTSVISLVLNASSLTDALSMLDSYSWVIEHNVDEIAKTTAMREELEGSRSQLTEDKAEADLQAANAEASLAEAKAAREEARQRALAAQRAEEEQRRAEAAVKAQEAAAKVQSATTQEEKEQAEAQAEEAQAEAAQAEEAESAASSENVGWDADKTAFVEKWAPRIDAYLAGSPTAGTGKYYAAAAWDNGVDPRWAPAISLVESSKGAACFRSYNAWGYGSSGFGSWQEGIETVVGALSSSLYGGYLTKQAAKTYCPPNWQHWYSKCASEMAQI